MNNENVYPGFTCLSLDEHHVIYAGRLPPELLPDNADFERLWAMHPTEYHEIAIHGRRVRVARWQQAFGADYHYTGRVNRALPVPLELEPFKLWSASTIDPRLNGLLLNWYDGLLGHYIGKHRDSTTNMVYGAPIVTISLGEDRLFRLRPWKRAGFTNFSATHGTVFVMPYTTNLAWTHEVPHRRCNRGQRISITLRAFDQRRSGEQSATAPRPTVASLHTRRVGEQQPRPDFKSATKVEKLA